MFSLSIKIDRIFFYLKGVSSIKDQNTFYKVFKMKKKKKKKNSKALFMFDIKIILFRFGHCQMS